MFADNITMIGITELISKNNMSRFRNNTGENIDMRVCAKESKIYSYGNKFKGGLVTNNGTIIFDRET